MNRPFYSLLLIFLLFATTSLIAHESRPFLLEIKEIQSDTYSVLWKSPEGGLMKGKLYPVFPASCAEKTSANSDLSYARVSNQLLYCEGGLAGKSISVHGLDLNIGISAFVRISFLSGQTHTKILLNISPEYLIPEKENKATIIQSYTILGIKHIALGVDHLLFIVCLMILVQNYKLLLWTITGFTVAHSISLAASVLNLVRLPTAYVETCIALSIVFLAAEIVRGNKQSLSYRLPFLVSSFFGLFHGLGFANVLLELGLPQTALGLGLLFFNIGVELGQIAFILLLLLIGTIIRLLQKQFEWQGKQTFSYQEKIFSPVIGSIAAFWVIQRLEDFV
jgi:hydrogenase/urease accessory protein HupE